MGMHVRMLIETKTATGITQILLFKHYGNFKTKKGKFSDKKKKSDIFHISAQNIDCGRGGSNEYPQSLVFSKKKKKKKKRKKKNNVYPCKSEV